MSIFGKCSAIPKMMVLTEASYGEFFFFFCPSCCSPCSVGARFGLGFQGCVVGGAKNGVALEFTGIIGTKNWV